MARKGIRKYQDEVQRLHDKYCIHTNKNFVKWARTQGRDEYSPWVSQKKDKRWCTICGEHIVADESGKFPRKCPHCGAEIHIAERGSYGVDAVRRSFRDWYYLEEITTCRGWQIDRIYVADYHYRSGHPYELERLIPVFERWFNPTEGKEVLLGKHIGMFPNWRRIPWALSNFGKYEMYAHRTLQLQVTRESYYGSLNYYNENYTSLYPSHRLLPLYEESEDIIFGTPYKYERAFLFRALLRNKENICYETMLKIGRAEEIAFMLKNKESFAEYWDSIKVARRHGYRYWEHSEYFDLLRMLKSEGLDMHSPKYVAPTDFKAMHDDLVRKRNARLEAEERERRRLAEIARSERLKAELERKKKEREEYIVRMSKYFALCLTNEKFTANPLKSVDEFYEEGKAMEHCVFSGEYYSKSAHPDSLILSVRDRETDNRVVTIEVSTKDWEIKQCYAKRDHTSPFDKEIREWINGSMGIIKSFSTKKITRSVATA